MEYKIEDLTKEDAAYIGEKINEIVPHEVDAEVEEFVLKVENEAGEIVGGCIAQAYEYRWSRMFLDTLWVDERYRHHGLGSMIIRYSLVKYLDRETPEYVPSDNSGARFRVSLGSRDDADVIENGIRTYSEAYEPEYESVDFYKKLVDKDGRFIAGVIADVDKDAYGFVDALFVEEALRHQGLGTSLLKAAEDFTRENGASMILTNAGDWNVDFFKKNGYLLRGELKDVPKGHDCYELYKMI